MENMKKTIELIKEKFESSSSKTEQYLKFHKTFKSEFNKMLKPITKNILVNKPNHFDRSGFIELNNNQIYYFNISDLRYSKNTILIRTAKDFKDYSGGFNNILDIKILNQLDNYFKIKGGLNEYRQKL